MRGVPDGVYVYAVPSASEPGKMHDVKVSVRVGVAFISACSCAGFANGHRCRHVRAIEQDATRFELVAARPGAGR